MKLKFSILAAALFLGLAGCVPDEEDQTRLKAALPKGCAVTNLESYGSIALLVIVDCSGRHVTSTTYNEKSGKSSFEYEVLYITDAY